jgi:hypothetical protein
MMSTITEGFGRKIIDDHRERGDWYFFNCPRCGKLLEVEDTTSVECCGLKFTPELFAEVVVTNTPEKRRKPCQTK